MNTYLAASENDFTQFGQNIADLVTASPSGRRRTVWCATRVTPAWDHKKRCTATLFDFEIDLLELEDYETC